jgi:hypothetical protein
MKVNGFEQTNYKLAPTNLPTDRRASDNTDFASGALFTKFKFSSAIKLYK